MPKEKEPFVVNRAKSVGFAFKGLFLLLKTESSIQIQAVIALLVTGFGFWMDLSPIEWMFQTLAIGMVMAVEGLNTAVEKLADYTQPQFDDKIGFIKDVSAGAVMFMALAAVIVGLIIYLPKFI